MRLDPEDGQSDFQSDGRRARLADVQRLESAIVEATARLKTLEEFIAKRDNSPISRGEFYGHVYAMAALAGKRPGAIRDWADLAWKSYQDALTDAPRPTLEEVYGGKTPEPDTFPSNESAGC